MKSKEKEIAIKQINEMLSALSYDRIRIIYIFVHKLFVSS